MCVCLTWSRASTPAPSAMCAATSSTTPYCAAPCSECLAPCLRSSSSTAAFVSASLLLAAQTSIGVLPRCRSGSVCGGVSGGRVVHTIVLYLSIMYVYVFSLTLYVYLCNCMMCNISLFIHICSSISVSVSIYLHIHIHRCAQNKGESEDIFAMSYT